MVDSKDKTNVKEVPTNASQTADEKRLGQILFDLKYVNVEQLSQALFAQQQFKKENPGKPVPKLGQCLLFLKIIDLNQLQNALRLQTSKANETKQMILEAKQKLNAMREAKAASKERRDRTSFWQRLTTSFSKKKK